MLIDLAHNGVNEVAFFCGLLAGGGCEDVAEVELDGDFALERELDGPVEVAEPEVACALFEGGLRGKGAVDALVDVCFEVEVELVEEVFFIGEVEEEGAGGDARALRDFGGGSAQADFGDLGDGCVEDCASLFRAAKAGHCLSVLHCERVDCEERAGAGDRDRTGDIQLGKLTFCH